MDVCGPYPVKALDGSRYFLTILDEGTDYSVRAWCMVWRFKVKQLSVLRTPLDSLRLKLDVVCRKSHEMGRTADRFVC
jgi:hypothetical protein